MSKFNPDDHPHVRFNILKGEWVLISPHRMKRPWQGQVEKQPINDIKRHDPSNPLCPNAKRPNGIINPDYEGTFLFDNDFPALFDYELLDGKENLMGNKSSDDIENDLFQIQPAKGKCQVMCFHPYSDLTLSTMEVSDIIKVINKWLDILAENSLKYNWVQIFENKGAAMGCSNPHPHCQVWSSNYLPNEIETKHRTQLEFYQKHKKVMLVEYLNKELVSGERVVVQNEDWAVLVPYWAVWPYETLLLPKRHIIRMSDIKESEKQSLAKIMKQLLIKYDNLFECNFPYSMGFHFAPTGSYLNEDCSHWQFHASYLPPLLRSAQVKKHMVGYELLAQAQRDLTPEKAASQLRDLSDVHYLSKSE